MNTRAILHLTAPVQKLLSFAIFVAIIVIFGDRKKI